MSFGDFMRAAYYEMQDIAEENNEKFEMYYDKWSRCEDNKRIYEKYKSGAPIPERIACKRILQDRGLLPRD